MIRKTAFISLCVLAAIFFATWAGAAEKVKIGTALPLTGSAANDGQMARDGVILALDQNKARPELQKYSIEIVNEDDKSDPKDAAAIGNKFAGDKEILAVVGDYNSSCTLAAAPILTKEHIVQISPGSSSPTITGFSKYLFRTQPTDTLVAVNIVKWANALGFKKAAVVYENSDFGKAFEQMYKDLWTKAGGSIVADESYLPGSTMDFTPILTKVKGTGADCVLMASLYNEASLMAKQSKQLKLHCTFFGDTSQYTNALLDLGKGSVEGWHVVGAMDPSAKDKLAANFNSAFEKKFGHAPNPFAAQAYDAMLIILEGLAKNGPDRDKLQTYISNVKDFPCVTGKTTFKDGDVEKPLFRFIVKGGKFEHVEK